MKKCSPRCKCQCDNGNCECWDGMGVAQIARVAQIIEEQNRGS